jgi:hypothetical protein
MTHGPELVPLQAYMAAKCEVCVCDCQSKIDALQAEVLGESAGWLKCTEMRLVAEARALAAEARVKELIDADAGRNALLDKAEARVEVLLRDFGDLSSEMGEDCAAWRFQASKGIEHAPSDIWEAVDGYASSIDLALKQARAALGVERGSK